MTKFSFLRLLRSCNHYGLRPAYEAAKGDTIESCSGHYKVTTPDRVLWIPAGNVAYAVESSEEKVLKR
jgi:hypothetical protein